MGSSQTKLNSSGVASKARSVVVQLQRHNSQSLFKKQGKHNADALERGIGQEEREIESIVSPEESVIGKEDPLQPPFLTGSAMDFIMKSEKSIDQPQDNESAFGGASPDKGFDFAFIDSEQSPTKGESKEYNLDKLLEEVKAQNIVPRLSLVQEKPSKKNR